MLPWADANDTSPPWMAPDTLVMSPWEAMVRLSLPERVPPMLSMSVTASVTVSAAMTAPLSMDATVTGDRYTTGAKTFWPSTKTSTIQTMSVVKLAIWAGVRALPYFRPRSLALVAAFSMRDWYKSAALVWAPSSELPVCAISCWLTR